jgi:hypothetical protein
MSAIAGLERSHIGIVDHLAQTGMTVSIELQRSKPHADVVMDRVVDAAVASGCTSAICRFDLSATSQWGWPLG